MQDFPGNSQKKAKAARPETSAQEEPPRAERITTAEADRRKRGLAQKFKGVFINGNARDTTDYIVSDIVVPAVRDMIYDAFEGGLQRLIYGESNRSGRRSPAPNPYSNIPRVDYAGMSSKPYTAQPSSPRMLSRRARSTQDFREIIIDDRREAEDVREQMFEILDRFGDVKVSDLYTMTGIASSHVDHKWGWTSLQGTKLIRTRDGRFLLDLPEPIALT